MTPIKFKGVSYEEKFFIAFSIFADDVAQGPFKIPGSDSFIVVKKVHKIVDGESYPYLNLDVINSNGEGYTLDEYEHEGGEPKIESVFLLKIKVGLQYIR